MQVQRDTMTLALQLDLPPAWRQLDDISWRASSWGLRRMTTGGMLLEPATEEQRQAAKVGPETMALHVKHVGEYGEHAVAKNAGVHKGDILVAFDERRDLTREADIFRQGLWEHKPGDLVPITIVRDGREMEFRILMQK